MGSEGRFVYNPSTVDISLSAWNMNNKWQGDIYHGDLNCVDITFVMPGDRFKKNLASFVRTATNPIAPIMDNIEVYYASYFVPKRLVFDKTKQFYGETVDGYGIASDVQEPRDTSGNQTIWAGDGSTKRCLASQVGLVRQKQTPTTPTPIALNPLRAVLQCYNDWYRNENFMAPYLWNHSQTGDNAYDLATLNGVTINASTLTTDSVIGSLPKVCKKLDRFTSCLPWAQKAVSAVLLPLGTAAPVLTSSTEITVNNVGLKWKTTGGVSKSNTPLGIAPNGVTASDPGSAYPGTGDALVPSNLYADLTNATAATINQLRMAFATQRYFEALARSGSKYREYIKGIFGVNIGDTTAQMAEYLGGYWYHLNVDQVVQTTGYSAGNTSTLGSPGAISVSGQSDFMFHKGFVEPGYVITFCWTKHDRTYGQGIDDLFLKHELFDEYNPKFANIGEQALKKGFLYFSGEKSDDETPFGFQEAWSEYRHKRDIVTGLLAPSNSSSYNYWNLAENFASAPSLNADFLTENRDNIVRCLAGGSASPDYFVDLYFQRQVARPMPLWSIPGLIDHH